MIRVVHVISDLDTGGAEVMLAKLMDGMDRRRFANTVVSLTDRGELGTAIESGGTAVHSLGMRRGRPDLSGLPKLIRILKAVRPHLVQSWLYHADFLSTLAVPFAGSPPLVWNVRCSDMDFTHYPRQTKWIVRALAVTSRWATAVVSNSEAGVRLHQRRGYRPRRWTVIPNGFDLVKFCPDSSARARLREELALPGDSLLIGLVARVDPMKDHRTFLTAASRVAAANRGMHFVLAGKGTDTLGAMVAGYGLTGRVHLLGARRDVERLLPGLDVCCLSSSFGEGFPNVLGEAMACGVPCVATDVGDIRSIVGETGVIVPPRDPAALAEAILDLVHRGPSARRALGQTARARIEKHYALPRVIEQYQALYEGLCGRAS